MHVAMGVGEGCVGAPGEQGSRGTGKCPAADGEHCRWVRLSGDRWWGEGWWGISPISRVVSMVPRGGGTLVCCEDPNPEWMGHGWDMEGHSIFGYVYGAVSSVLRDTDEERGASIESTQMAGAGAYDGVGHFNVPLRRNVDFLYSAARHVYTTTRESTPPSTWISLEGHEKQFVYHFSPSKQARSQSSICLPRIQQFT